MWFWFFTTQSDYFIICAWIKGILFLGAYDTNIVKSLKTSNNFYSHAPCGARLLKLIFMIYIILFLLTCPLRGATALHYACVDEQEFLLTRPLRGATYHSAVWHLHHPISTHTPLAGRDLINWIMIASRSYFYSHAPCGARHPDCIRLHHRIHFYSHAPCGARRLTQRPRIKYYGNFYSHAPCGARPPARRHGPSFLHFYSHAPCGARHFAESFPDLDFWFLLTRPLRGATLQWKLLMLLRLFLLTRPLRGATTLEVVSLWLIVFLLTRPLRGATITKISNRDSLVISTHTPLAGRDVMLLIF